MIHMPKRSVTRFFIPLIDVLLLLFCIFLLMPMATEEAKVLEDKELKEKYELARERVKELEKTKPERAKMADLTARIKELEAFKARPLEKFYVRGIDVDAAGNMVHRQKFSKVEEYKIQTKEDAHNPIRLHRDSSGGREVFYLFHLENKGALDVSWRRRMEDWFDGVSYAFEAEKGP